MNKAFLLVGAAGLGLVAYGVSKAQAANPPTPPDQTGGPTFTITGRSGFPYLVAFVKAFDTEAGKQSFWDVYDLASGNRLVRYTQIEDDTNSRIFIVSPLDMSDSRLDVAMRDFGIRFEGGAVAIPVSATEPLRAGQMLVAPGEWLATVDVSFPKSLAVSKALIKAALEEQGFKQVAVFNSVPKFWPISTAGNYFIQAVWDRDARIFNVPKEVVDVRSRALV